MRLHLNSITDFEDLTNGTIVCVTRYENCCNESYAFWRSPSGLNATDIFNVSHGASLLHIQRTAEPVQPQHNGRWTCVITSVSGRIVHRHISLYQQGNPPPPPPLPPPPPPPPPPNQVKNACVCCVIIMHTPHGKGHIPLPCRPSCDLAIMRFIKTLTIHHFKSWCHHIVIYCAIGY